MSLYYDGSRLKISQSEYEGYSESVMEKVMEKITVMVPIECDISVHPSGRIRVHSCINPDFNTIEDQLMAIPKAECVDTMKFLAIIDDWVIAKK